MDFHILGPLRAEADGTPVAVPPGKATVLLLRLLSDVGRPVGVDVLVDALWPSTPPRDARAALQVKVSQLRRALEPHLVRAADSTVIASRGDAYLIRPDAGHVIDAEQFAGLVADARRAHVENRTEEAARLLGEALDLWGGQVPLMESDALWAVAVRARLLELQRRAREERADLILGLGEDPDVVVADLESLCADEPLRERSHELLMRALYRTGRQADALAVYDTLRGQLADELGVDPTPPLRDLHRRILVHDPVLDESSRYPRRAALPIPITGFIDAGDRVDRVRSLLRAARLVTLTGPGGTGKTRLALETARMQASSVVWFVDLTSVPRMDGVAEAVATALGAVPAAPDVLAGAPSVEDPVARIAGHLGGREALLVLDNCEHVLEGAAAFSSDVLGDCAGLRILATSRQALGIPGEAVWSLPALGIPPPEATGAAVTAYPAVELLVDRLRESTGDALSRAQDADLLAEIARRLDGIPLALELVAGRARTLSLAAIVRRLDDRLRLLTGAQGFPERHRTLTAVVDWSWQLLEERQRTTATTCAAFSDVFDSDDVAAIDPTIRDRWEAEEILLELAERSLLTVHSADVDGEPTFGMLATVREFARRHLLARGDAAVVEAALTRRCLEVVADAGAELRGPNRRTALDVLDRHGPDLTAALERSTAAGDRATALSLAVGLGWWWIHGRRSEGTHRLVEAMSCPGMADPLLEADAHRWTAFVGQGTLPWSEILRLAQEALEGYVALGHDLGRGLSLLIMASCGRHTDRYDRARVDAGEAAAVFDRLGDRWGLATATLIGVDVDLADTSTDHEEDHLLDRIDRAAALFDDLGDGWGRVHALSRRAAYLERHGRTGDAEEEHLSARREAERLGLDLTQA